MGQQPQEIRPRPGGWGMNCWVGQIPQVGKASGDLCTGFWDAQGSVLSHLWFYLLTLLLYLTSP